MDKTEYLLGKDFLLDPNNDVIFGNNDIVLTEGNFGIKQKLKKKIQHIAKSLYADWNWGGVYQASISQPLGSSLVGKLTERGQRELEEELEVKEVPSYTVVPDTSRGIIYISTEVLFRDNTLEKIQQTTKMK